MCGSTSCERRYSSSTSGWSWAVDSTRAITRRCSVIRMPFSAQGFAIRSVTELSELIPNDLGAGAGQVETHGDRIDRTDRAAIIIAAPEAGAAKTCALVERDRRWIVDRHLQEDRR